MQVQNKQLGAAPVKNPEIYSEVAPEGANWCFQKQYVKRAQRSSDTLVISEPAKMTAHMIHINHTLFIHTIKAFGYKQISGASCMRITMIVWEDNGVP